MSQTTKRVKRPKLERTGPLRDFSSILREEEAPHEEAQSTRTNGGAASDTFADAVTHGTRVGYSVVQEQIENGRRVAQQWSQLARGGGGADNDLTQLMQRVLQFSTDLGSLLVDLTDAAVRRPAASPSSGGDAPRSQDRHSSAAQEAPRSQLSVDVEAPGRSKVILDLNAGSAGDRLAVPGLYALDGKSAPLTDIAFEAQTLRVRVPADQPAGTYSGVVVDRDTNEPRGTLSVRLTR